MMRLNLQFFGGRGSTGSRGSGGGSAWSQSDAEEEQARYGFDVSSQEFSERTQYTGGRNAALINTALREGKVPKELQKNVDALDEYMTPLSKSLQTTRMVNDWGNGAFQGAIGVPADSVWSAIQSGNASSLKKYEGKVITDKAFVSTSYDMTRNVGQGFPVKVELTAPKGTKAIVTNNVKESEVILHRNLKYRTDS